MTVFTNPASAVFKPTTADGAARGADMGEAQTWGVEVETAINASEAEIDSAQAELVDVANRLLAVEAIAVDRQKFLAPVAVATTANITLSGEQTIDGVVTSASRILVKNQSAAAENGVYVTAAGAWSRATDADASDELSLVMVYVQGGTVEGGRTFFQQTPTPTVGSSNIVWVQTDDSDISSYQPQMLLNEKFSTSASWTLGGGFAISGGLLVATGGTGATQAIQTPAPSYVAGDPYVAKVFVQDATTGGISPRISGTYNNIGTAFPNGEYYERLIAPTGANAFSLMKTTTFDGKVNETGLIKLTEADKFHIWDSAQSRIAGEANSIEEEVAIVAHATTEAFYTPNANIRGIGKGFRPTEFCLFGSVVFHLGGLAAVTSMTFKVWKRPVGRGDGATTIDIGGLVAEDVLVYSETKSPLAWGVAVNVGTTPIRFRPTDRILCDPQYYYLLEVHADAMLVPEYSDIALAVEPDILRGYRINLTPAGLEDDTFAIPATISVKRRKPVESGRGAVATKSSNEDEFDALTGAFTTAQTLSVPIPAVSIYRPGADTIITLAQSVTIAAPGSSTVSADPFTMTDGGRILLDSVCVENVEVYEGAVLLVEGTDYMLDDENGVIIGLKNASVTVNYDKRAPRIDMIYAQTQSGTGTTPGRLGTAAGAARDTDPANAMAARPDNAIPLFMANITHKRVRLVPVHGFDEGLRRVDQDIFETWRRVSRKRLQATLKAARAGSAITILAKGDSITALGGATSTTTPNGDRDQSDYLTRTGSDIIAAMTGYSGGDAMGRTGTHYRYGWNWFIRDALIAVAGSAVGYDNYGVGSTSAPGAVADAPGMAALTAAIGTALGAGQTPLVTLAYGTNAPANIQGNVDAMRTMISTFKGDGAEVLVIGPPAVSELTYINNRWSWVQAHNALWQLCDEEGAAYVPTLWAGGPGYRGCNGVSTIFQSSENGHNHPGIKELRAIGEIAAAIFE